MILTIYIDVLIAVNLFINYFIIFATAKFLYIKASKSRILIGSSLGAIYSLYILLPQQNVLISLMIKLFMASTIVWITFCFPKSSIYLKTLLCFYSMSFIFSGLMFAIWCAFEPRGMYVKNSVVYFNISPSILVVSTIVSYAIIEMINKIVGRQKAENSFYEVEIKLFGTVFSVNAKLDTGNNLKEAFSGLPVIIVRESSVRGIVAPDLMDVSNIFKEKSEKVKIKYKTCSKLRLIPFSSIAGCGLLPGFKSEYVSVKGIDIKREAYIAVCSDKVFKGEFEGLICPELVR